ncbi:branched-chain amino acid ABC transporter permease [Roseobacter sp. HKCCD9010]|uniref:branched-chain amino acid ABC transporter permease n=1 Tax=unclassified Roseobacter TaxID=196798 RepID=UPI0014931C9A|nr:MULTISPECIES: branched-chain amino acid ABC transporter permease [unclassified Roseobacter]MBF9048650.1 branched-chain amino acid ABC transporter permease [Rhodobacterales bacterium HKCCD4356]NNV10649.1 branched-chain amino acid ABC transporter permease [Roseobacter sp. HKCCD7357]NNV14834.1 branched-chain amino acid ABC transporter permease [Roseobacter sp. HKCCD8768]NNV24293.1 branched-chain amino acid ABC transporter permease [Roseobacter sp. HKCCD8192]NNV28550.1 branched-chain amino acid
MFYREAGDFKTSYTTDNQTFPIAFDRYRYYFVLFVALAVIPFIINDYWSNAILLPFLIYAIAAMGLNILTGYCGQVSLGTGGFMAVGAYTSYKLMTAFPWMDMVTITLLSGFMTAIVGVMFGLPSLRIKGFYLAVATLAAQFFLVWLFNKVPWFYNYSASGQINAPERTMFGLAITGPNAESWVKYLFCLGFVFVLAWAARNLTRGSIGRQWMAIRDMDIAAEIIGVNPLKAKLTAFAVSSFYVGVSGALLFTVYLGAVEVGEAYGITKSFLVLFMIIIGGLGSIFGAFAGAAFMVLLPVLLRNVLTDVLGWDTALATHFEFVIVGALIMFFLIVEPHGLARLWALLKEKLRLWPFPH